MSMRALTCALLLTLPLCGCGKKKTQAYGLPKESALPAVPTLLSEAARLGLAARIPADVEFCLSSVNLKRHAAALTASQWWKEWAAFVDEKTPVSSGGLRSLKFEEVFLALGAGSSQSMAVLRQLNDLYNETAYRGLMSGGPLAGLGQRFDLAQMLNAALSDPQALEALILLLERFEMPPVICGVATPEPDKTLAELSQALGLPQWLGGARTSRIVTTQAEQFTVHEVALAEWLTLERRQQWLELTARLVPSLTPDMRDRLSRGLDVLADKRWVLALGQGRERAYLAVGAKKEQVKLASGVADSILARPGFRFADTLAQHEGLGLLACWEGAFLDVMQSAEPFQPLVRGALAGLQAEPAFRPLAQRLLPLATDLAEAERDCFRTEHTSGAAVAWWDQGLRVMWEGGVNAASIPVLAEASRFSPLLEGEAVVLGASGPGGSTGAGRRYFEAWMRFLHGAAVELIQAGMGGEQARTALPVVETTVLPPVLELYAGTQLLWQQGLGADGAWLLDVGGQMPELPGLPPGGQEVPLPRVLLAQDLKDRAAVSAAWGKIESSLAQVLKMVPAPQPLALPEVRTQRGKGLTTHALVLPLESDDLKLCASLSADALFLGTSRLQQLAAAEGLSRKEPVAAGTRMRLNATALRKFLKAYVTVRGSTPELRQLLRWLEPVETLDAWQWADGCVARGRLIWRLHDVRSYD